jgi:hypothetical protein
MQTEPGGNCSRPFPLHPFPLRGPACSTGLTGPPRSGNRIEPWQKKSAGQFGRIFPLVVSCSSQRLAVADSGRSP